MQYADCSIVRGCGNRQQGGVYAESGRAPYGRPVEDFLLCPPVLVDAADAGLSPVGVKLVKTEGVWHVWDVVGSKYYPNVADFIEEVRRFGLSRKMSKGINFGKLTEKSRIFLLHSRAYIDDPLPFQESRIGGKALGLDWDHCPRGKHDSGETGMCAGLLWEDVEKMAFTIGRKGRRDMPAFSYVAACPPVTSTCGTSAGKSGHSMAIFASFPIMRLAVVASEDGTHEKTADRVRASSLPVDVVME